MRVTEFLCYKTFIRQTVRRYTSNSKNSYDVVILGGGLMGLTSAFFLAKRINPSSICVIERDLKVLSHKYLFNNQNKHMQAK